MSKAGLALGFKGEGLACDFLIDNGYKIIKRNYRTKLGQIDIIAKDKDTLCFIEVKTRTSDMAGLPEEAITVIKQRKISKIALIYLKENQLLNKRARFDVVSILFNEGGFKINLIKDAFELGGSYAY